MKKLTCKWIKPGMVVRYYNSETDQGEWKEVAKCEVDKRYNLYMIIFTDGKILHYGMARKLSVKE